MNGSPIIINYGSSIKIIGIHSHKINKSKYNSGIYFTK